MCEVMELCVVLKYGVILVVVEMDEDRCDGSWC